MVSDPLAGVIGERAYNSKGTPACGSGLRPVGEPLEGYDCVLSL